jgi:hypothetical protein
MTVASPTQQTHALFVAWQHQESRRYYPVGRLVAGAIQGQPRYEFAYVLGANEAAKFGWQPFMSFPELQRVYLSDDLFPLFSNRLMSPRRPDYPEYVSNLGLTPNADPIAVLARSGGRRVTDALEVFELPLFDPGVNCYQTYFLAHGIRYLAAGADDRIQSLRNGDHLCLMSDFQNPADPRAIALRTEDSVIVGYMPRYLLDDAWELVETCGWIKVHVAQANPAPAPIEQRLLCRFESCWPDGFRPFCSGQYKPIPPDAVKLDPCLPNQFV